MSEPDKQDIVENLRKGFERFANSGINRESVDSICDCQKECLSKKEPVNILEIAEIVGLEGVYECSLTENVSGMLDRQERKVYIEKTEPVRRKRFTCAHEVGHFLLHDYHDVVLLRSSRTDDIEEEANSLAAEILMPEYFMRKFANELERDSNALADLFFVSEHAAAYRMYNLGISRK